MPDRSQRVGRYELVTRIGQGGMGVVYLAQDPLLQRKVAIKLLGLESSDLRERFSREARAVGSLNHPNIVHIYDVGEDDGRSFIAMEYVAGETLADIVNRKAPLPLARKLEITLDLCAGLLHAHRMGIVHRDVKPANVMLDDGGAVKILDFGLARVLDVGAAGLTRHSQMVGTPHYMAPEQIQGGAIDKRTDVYGVGLVLYELLAYVKAYPGDTPYSVILRVINEEPEPLERLCPGLDPSLIGIVKRASEKIPARRYDDLTRMIADLNRMRERLPPLATDDTVVMPSQPRTASDHSNSGNLPAMVPDASPVPLVSRTPARFTREEFLRRRGAAIVQLLARAKAHFERGEFDAVLEQCQTALLHDPDDPRIEELIRDAERAIEARNVSARLAEAERLFDYGDLTAADLALDDVLSLRNGDAAALDLQRRLRQQRRDQEQVAERAHRVGEALQYARSSLHAGHFESALRAATQALAHDAGNVDALAIRDGARSSIEARNLRFENERLEAADRSAERLDAIIDRALGALDRGDVQTASELLSEADAIDGAVSSVRLAELARSIAGARAAAEAAAERRRQVDRLRGQIETALAAGDFHTCATNLETALAIAPADSKLLRLSTALQIAIEERRTRDEQQRSVDAAIVEAQALAARGAFDDALGLLDGLPTGTADQIAPAAATIREMKAEGERKRAAAAAERARAGERHESFRQHLLRAERALAAQDLETAAAALDAAAQIDGRSVAVNALRQDLARASEMLQRRAREDQRAADVIRTARDRFERGEHQAALTSLERFAPIHVLVNATLDELRNRRAALKRQEIAAAQEQARAQRTTVADALVRATDLAERGELERALRELDALPTTHDDPDLSVMRADLVAQLESRDAVSADRESRIQRCLNEASALARAERADDAIRLLEQFVPPDARVEQALDTLRGTYARRHAAPRIPTLQWLDQMLSTRRWVAALSAACLVLAVSLLAAAYFHQSRTTAPDPIGIAQQLWARDRPREALAALRSKGSESPAAAELARRILQQQTERAKQIADKARDSGAGDTAAYRQADAAAQRAAGLTRAGKWPEAFDAWNDAVISYQASWDQAPALTRAAALIQTNPRGSLDLLLQVPAPQRTSAKYVDTARILAQKTEEQARNANTRAKRWAAGRAEFKAAEKQLADAQRVRTPIDAARGLLDAAERFDTVAVQAVSERAREQFASGRSQAAIDTLRAGTAAFPTHPDLARQIKQFRREAEQRAETARVDAAQNRQADTTTAWRAAGDAAHRATQIAENDVAAIELWSAAERNYREAARAASPSDIPASNMAALWTSGKRTDALAQADRVPSDPAVQRLVTDWQQQAQGVAAQSKAAALQAGATDEWPSAFREARTLEQRASGERGVAATRDWLDAADGFNRAKGSAQAARTALDDARTLWERQQRAEALDALHKGNESFPGYPGFQQFSRDVARTAENEAQAAEAAAQQRRAQTSPEYGQAASAMAGARAAVAAHNFEDAARGFLTAIQAFKGAQPEPTPTKTPSIETDASIRKALDDYKRAYESLDTGAMAAIFPSARSREVETRRRACKTVEVTFTNVRIHQPANNEVFVEVQSTYTCTPSAGKRQPPQSMGEYLFFAQRQTGDWYVTRTGHDDNR